MTGFYNWDGVCSLRGTSCLQILFILTQVLYSSPGSTNYGKSERATTEDGLLTVTWHLAKVLSRRHRRLCRMVSRTGTTRSVFNAAKWRLVASSWRARSRDLGNSLTATTPHTRKPDLHSYHHQSASTCTTANCRMYPLRNCISSRKLNSRSAVQEIPSHSI